MRTRQTVQMLALCATLSLVACVELHAQQKPNSAELVEAPLSVADDEPAAPLHKQKQTATEHLAQTTGAFTIAVLPDTQYYCDCRLKLSAKWGNGDLRRYFFEQTEWVRDHHKRLNIAFLVHEGDIVQTDLPEEWAIARKAMSVLDGKVPYCMCLGNHDMGFQKSDNKYGGNIGVNRTTHFNTYFPREKFAKQHEFGGTFDPDRHDNSWYHFEAAGMKFLIVALEYHPRDEVLAWANRIVAEHPDHRAIVLTHSYLKGNKKRTTNKLKLKGNNGEQMWQKFVRKHKNMFMVLCGHFSGEAVLTSAGDHGNQVHQILSDYQEMNNGGESWLRYMVFKPEANKISIHTYNPALDKFRNGPSSRFDLDYPMAQPLVTAPGITRPGDANDVNKEAEQDGADQPATATESPAAESTQFLGAANGFEKEAIKALADRVRGHVNSQPLRFPNQHWVRGTYYAGLLAMYESTSDSAYLDDCMKWGKKVAWQIKEQGGGPYESGAYPLICGQIWYGCYRAKKDGLMMQPTLAFLEDPKVENPLSAPGEWYLENTGHHFVDGLFTAPPALAMLYQMTGEEKYVNWMDACFWDVHKEIYDPDADLFYRDARSKPRKTKNGKKVLWSRGNGWAFGGLTRILKYIPSEHPSYPKYKSLYMKMAESLAKRQQADGFWRSNLDDPELYPMKESSGSAFFCYGITWGINNGILNKERFLPVAMKAWTALTSVVNEDGKVGWSQPAGGGPGKVAEADTSKFGTGIFLLAASEVFLLSQSPAASKPLGLRPGPNATPAPSTPLGLYVEDGQLMRNGSKFRAMGINYTGAWYDVLKDPETLEVAEGFRILKQDYGIPFIRFSAGPYSHIGWKLYVEDPEEYLRRFDVLVKHAEAQGIGLIPSLFWFVCTMPDLQGEPLSVLGDPDSKCRTFMRKYIRDMVGRYKNSPAIWGWEVGNEWMLYADLPKLAHLPPKKIGSKETRTAADKLLRPMLLDAYKGFYKTVREIDPDRIIVTGDSIARGQAWHNRNEDSWGQDSKAQWAEVFRADTPDCYEVASFHLYTQTDKSYFKKKDLPIEDFVKEVVGICRSDSKVIWCGELGTPGNDEAARKMFSRMMHAVEENEIAISAIWNFKPTGTFQGDWDISPSNERAYMLDAVKALNERFAIGLSEDAAK